MLAEMMLTVLVAISPTVHPLDPALTPACVEVGEHLTVWQSRLELRDWSVGYSCKPDPELGDDAEGTTAVSQEERAVVIYIHPTAPDQEEVAAHELLHVLLGFVREADSELVEEQAVRILTRLLVAGKRCTQKVAP